MEVKKMGVVVLLCLLFMTSSNSSFHNNAEILARTTKYTYDKTQFNTLESSASNFSIFNTIVKNKVEIKVKIESDYVKYNNEYGYPFVDINGRTQVPLRITLESFGAKVNWDAVNKTAIIENSGNIVKVPLGQSYIYVNNKKIPNDTSAVLVGQRIYVPIRVIMESLGCEVVWDNTYNTVIIKRIDVISGLPTSFDLRNNGGVTSVKDQGPLGTCWAFATIGALESTLMPYEKWDFSENNMSLQHGFNLTQNDGGDYYMALAYLTRWAGPVKETDDPYAGGFSPVNIKAVKRLQEAIIIPEKDYNQIKRAIYSYGAVQSSIYTPLQNANSTSIYYNNLNNAYYYDGSKKSNHDIVIVGWDDNYSKNNFNVKPEYDGAFICKNSWGEEFGENGYFYISYYDNNIGVNNIVYSRIDNAINYDNIYQTDQLGWVGNLGYNKNTAFFSNVYTAQNKEMLKAVSFYATDVNTEYEVYVVKNFVDVNSLRSRELIKKGKIDFAGYYTVDFNTNDLILNKGTKFAVVVKITTPNSLYPVAIEFNAGEATKFFNINDGEGYISLDGRYWESVETRQKSNLCLKAFTKNIN